MSPQQNVPTGGANRDAPHPNQMSFAFLIDYCRLFRSTGIMCVPIALQGCFASLFLLFDAEIFPFNSPPSVRSFVLLHLILGSASNVPNGTKFLYPEQGCSELGIINVKENRRA